MSLLFKVVQASSNTDVVVNSIISKIVDNIVLPILSLLASLTVILFVWGLISFFRSGDDAKARESGRQHILWGVIGIVIMISVYGIVRFVASSLGQSSVLPF